MVDGQPDRGGIVIGDGVLIWRSLAERVGMRQEAHLVENEWFKGAWGDEIDYAMLQREWLSKRT